MKKIMLTIALIVTLSVTTKNVEAQDYRAALGLSIGAPMGIDYKQFFSPRSAINATFGYSLRRKALTIGAVYQYHIPLVENLNLYAGGGVNFGKMYLGYKYHNHSSNNYIFGLTPNLGMEYKFEDSPIVIGLDYRPSINLTTVSQWEQVSLKVRYTF